MTAWRRELAAKDLADIDRIVSCCSLQTRTMPFSLCFISKMSSSLERRRSFLGSLLDVDDALGPFDGTLVDMGKSSWVFKGRAKTGVKFAL